MPAIRGTGKVRHVTPLITAAVVALGAFVAFGVLARGASAQPPSTGNGAARFDDLRELNNKLARVIQQVQEQVGPHFWIRRDFGKLRRTLKDLEVTKLPAVDQFPPVFGLPYGETFRELSCIDSDIAVAQEHLLGLEEGAYRGHTTLPPYFNGQLFASVRVLRALENAKACKDTLEQELASGVSMPAGVSDDLRELNNKLSRAIGQVQEQVGPHSWIRRDFGKLRRTLKDLEVTKLRAVDQFPEILDPPYGETFRQLSCIDSDIAVAQEHLLGLEEGAYRGHTTLPPYFNGQLFASVRVLRALENAKACKDTLETQLMDSFNLKPSERASVGVSPTTPNGTDTQNPNKLNAPKTLEHAYKRDGFIGRHEQDYLSNGVNGSNPDSWPSGRSVLFFDVFDLFGSTFGAQRANQASQQNLKSSGFTPVQDSTLGPGEAAFQKQSGSLLGTIIYVQRGAFIMKIAGACNGCRQGSIDATLKTEAQIQLNRAVLMGFPGPAPSGSGGSGAGGGSSQSASGSLTNGSGTILNYSIQTNTASNAFELILPAGDDTSQVLPPSGFSCSDSGHIEFCTGNVMPNSPVTGDFDHAGTIGANCGCVQVAFSQDGGAHWSSPATLSGPSASSPAPGSAFSCTGTRSSSADSTWTVNITCNQPFSYLQLAGGSFDDRASGTDYDCPLYWNGQASSTSNTITFWTTASPAPANTATGFQAMWSTGFAESGLSATASPNPNGSGAVPVTFTN